jgi:putative transposase
MNYKSANHCVYNVSYHITWIPKYRRKILFDVVEDRLKQLLETKCALIGISIGAIECMPDHIHLFIRSNPKLSISFIVGQLKGYSSFMLRKEFSHLQNYKSLWTNSYFVETIGHISENVIKNYIANQKTCIK